MQVAGDGGWSGWGVVIESGWSSAGVHWSNAGVDWSTAREGRGWKMTQGCR